MYSAKMIRKNDTIITKFAAFKVISDGAEGQNKVTVVRSLGQGRYASKLERVVVADILIKSPRVTGAASMTREELDEEWEMERCEERHEMASVARDEIVIY